MIQTQIYIKPGKIDNLVSFN